MPGRIGEDARLVADINAARESAYAAERAAETLLLEEVAEEVRPALPSICSRILTGYDTSNGKDVKAWAADEHGTLIRGVLVQERDWFAAKIDADLRQELIGRRLYLLEDGTWFQHTRHGRHDVAANAERWETIERKIFGSAADVPLGRRDWNPETIVDSLAEALTAQLSGDTAKKTAASTERATRLNAVAALLRPPRDRAPARTRTRAR
jgi:hypothetical protein